MSINDLPTVGHLLEMQEALLSEIKALRGEVRELKDRDQSPYFTSKEAMAYLKLTRNTFKDRLRKAGVAPVKTEGGKLMYKREEIERIICKNS